MTHAETKEMLVLLFDFFDLAMAGSPLSAGYAPSALGKIAVRLFATGAIGTPDVDLIRSLAWCLDAKVLARGNSFR